MSPGQSKEQKFDSTKFLQSVNLDLANQLQHTPDTPEYIPSPQARQQTRDYLTAHQLSSSIIDGFQDGGTNSSINTEGLVVNSQREILTVDRDKDQNLRQLITEAKRIAKLYPDDQLRLAFEVAYIVDKKFGPTDISTLIDNQHLQHPGKIIFIGDLNHGVCRHRSLLFQILSSEIGLESTIQRGLRKIGNHMSQTPHAWNIMAINGEPYLIDTMNLPIDFPYLNYKHFLETGGFPMLIDAGTAPTISFFDLSGQRQLYQVNLQPTY